MPDQAAARTQPGFVLFFTTPVRTGGVGTSAVAEDPLLCSGEALMMHTPDLGTA